MRLPYEKRMALAEVLETVALWILRLAHKLDPSCHEMHHVSGITVEYPRRKR